MVPISKIAAPVAALMLALAPAAGEAQTGIGFAGGITNYDLSGTGNEAVLAVRVDRWLAASVRVEAGLGYFRYQDQANESSTMLLPELGVFVHPPLGPLPLYLGVGAGGFLAVSGTEESEATLFAAAGVEIPIAEGWFLRPEMRVRAVDPWTGVMADFTLGFARAF